MPEILHGSHKFREREMIYAVNIARAKCDRRQSAREGLACHNHHVRQSALPVTQ